MTSPWSKIFESQDGKKLAEKMIRVVRETYDFNNAICEGNNLLSILTLGMTMVKIMRANGMNDQIIIQHLQGLQEAVRMKQV